MENHTFQRRSAHSFPREMWTKLIAAIREADPSADELEEKRAIHYTLSSLSTVSHSIRALVQPVIFENVVLSFDCVRRNPKDRLQGLFALFESRLESRFWVKELPIVSLPGWRDSFQILMPILSAVFLKMLGLRLIDFSHAYFTQEMFDHLGRLMDLKSLVFSAHDDQEALDASRLHPDQWKLRVLELGKALSLCTVVTPLVFVKLALCPTIEKLTIEGEEISPVLWAFSETHSSHWFHNLTILETDPPTLDTMAAFVEFVLRCPNVEVLHLDRATQWYETCEGDHLQPLALSPTVLPRLRSFKGSIDHARLFIPRRPIDTLSVYGDYKQGHFTKDGLQLFLMGAAVVKSLEIDAVDWREGLIEDLAELFPELQFLGISHEPLYDPVLYMDGDFIQSLCNCVHRGTNPTQVEKVSHALRPVSR